MPNIEILVQSYDFAKVHDSGQNDTQLNSLR